MRQLDAGNGALRMDELGDARQHFDMPVFPDSEVSRRNASFRSNRRCLDHYQGCPANRTTAEMDEMPIVGKAIYGTILAHWRHGDAVAKSDAPEH
jgi:hypothetical protein